MRTAPASLAILLVLALSVSADDLVLPAGDPVRGREAFIALRCHACHRVQAATLPPPVASPPVPITLGAAPSAYTNERLVTAIIAPSHSIARPEYGESVAEGGLSRMGDFTSVMTVRQLVDIVAFLREHARK
jgi:mono/diheme cytochrome c family protein